MPQKMDVEVNGEQVVGVTNVEYDVSSEWDRKEGKVKGEITYSPVTIYREMQSDSPKFFRWAKQADQTFPVKVKFRRLSPLDGAQEAFLTLDVTEAFVVSYQIKHQDWKDERLGNYDPIEIVKLGYKKLKMTTADDNYELEFKKKS